MKETGIIHVFAECDDCTFKTGDHQHGIESVERHAKHQSHRVKIDVGKIEIIDRRKETL